ncbi:MAG TPA: hydantoinase B/oxoprolinase family protein [Cyclobacteriaceae bacterium]|nr:hydantoinase B/oxoprolinase family protein [Cyclobacteriaceae bacterium]
MPANLTPWKIWIDTGGTFTDCIGINPAGELRRLKILSSSVIKAEVKAIMPNNGLAVEANLHTAADIFKNFSVRLPDEKISLKIHHTNPAKGLIYFYSTIPNQIKAGTRIEITSHEEVPVLAARLLTETSLQKKFPHIEMKLGSTKGTNALLERKGAPTALIITRGFKDLLRIGTQQRPDLFSLTIEKEDPLYKLVVEADERMDANGKVLSPLALTTIPGLIKKIKAAGCTSVAIAFLHSYKNPTHEIAIKKKLLNAGIQFVTLSHEVSGQIKILPRAETAVTNAYLAPIIQSYLNRIQNKLTSAQLKIMTSAGGLVNAQQFFPKDSLLSGPAGGVVGAAVSGRYSGVDKLIAFDMGGTSTDVSLFNKTFSYRYESKVGSVRILSPSLEIETIAAGGGSICDFDGHKLTVGPHSAGASPGPACYGAGGSLTLTDVNLLVGKIAIQHFTIPLYRKQAENALRKVISKIYKHTGKQPEPEHLLESFLQIANEKMSEAIRKVSVQFGHNPIDYSLLSFGGAGGQHACALAQLLGTKKILIPYDAGLLSAYGIGHADVTHFEEQLILAPLTSVIKKWRSLFTRLKKKGFEKLVRDGYSKKEIILQKQITFLRFKGQESCIEVNTTDPEELVMQFKKRYKAIYGHWLLNRAIEVESVRIVALVKGYSNTFKPSRLRTHKPNPINKQKMLLAGKWVNASVYQWEGLTTGATINGPALVVSLNSTSVVYPGWQFKLDPHNHALLVQSKKQKHPQTHSTEASLELFSNRFTAIAQEMGAILQRSSFSVNVKERLDFSCAIMDADGYLIVNAPHIPVHLGSMGVCVREVMRIIPIREGDVIITNHPAYGGSHLPDITLIKPVFVNKKRVGFVANRAHHAEVGGSKPGSMPAHATTLAEEGVIIAPTYLMKQGASQWNEIKKVFIKNPYPTRSLDENLADLNGALASVNAGELLLKQLCEAHSTSTVLAHMNSLKRYAAQHVSEKIASLHHTISAATELLDDGSKLTVSLTRKKNKLVIDFTGSADVHPGNFNATPAIVQSVILYVLRVWINKPIAMNEGLMQHIQIKLPHGMLNPDFTKIQPAVVGGNTEVSQRLTDTLLKALQLGACSQGTMNNFLFGNARFGFYETICGGAGATEGYNGADAVHTNMTNTRITDAEILEHRYPVLLRRFEIRKNSGGKGKWKGGDGVIREVRFNEKMEVNLLTQHRKETPYGMAGGHSGLCGQQYLIRNNGEKIQLSGLTSVEVKAGDSIAIETPGGGGWGNEA